MLSTVNIDIGNSFVYFQWTTPESNGFLPSLFSTQFKKGKKEEIFDSDSCKFIANFLLMNYDGMYSLDLHGPNLEIYMEDFTIYYMVESSSKMMIDGKEIPKEGLIFHKNDLVPLTTKTKAFIDRQHIFIAMVNTYNGELHSCYQPSILTIKCLIEDNINELIKNKSKINFIEVTEERYIHGKKESYISAYNGTGYFSFHNLEIHVDSYSNLKDVPDIDVIISNEYNYDDFMFEVRGEY